MRSPDAHPLGGALQPGHYKLAAGRHQDLADVEALRRNRAVRRTRRDDGFLTPRVVE